MTNEKYSSDSEISGEWLSKEGSEIFDSASLLDIVARQRRELAGLHKRIADMETLLRQPISAPADRSRATNVEDSALVRQIELIIKARRLRETYLPYVEFGEAAWDILLDLTVARFWSRHTSISSLCIAARVPTTTALRCLKTLTEAAVLERRADPNDGRRSFVQISEAAYRDVLDLVAASLRDDRRIDLTYSS